MKRIEFTNYSTNFHYLKAPLEFLTLNFKNTKYFLKNVFTFFNICGKIKHKIKLNGGMFYEFR